MHLRHAGRSISNSLSLLSVGWMLTGLLVCFSLTASAQTGGSAGLSPPDISQFPAVTFYLEAYDSAGNFLTDLQAADLQILENDVPRPAADIQQSHTGLQITVAFNTAPLMANRSGADTAFQKIETSLQAWAKGQPSETLDDFTLVANDGVQTIRQTDPQRWVKDLTGYQPDLLHSTPSLSSLSQALDMGTDPNPDANMKRVLLYITSLPADNTLSAIPNIAERAAKMGMHTFVWLVAPPASEKAKGTEALRELARRTGGQLFIFTGAEALPDPESYLKPLRSLYKIRYTSAVSESGSQRLSVKIDPTGAKIQSPEQTFTLNVQPPNPMFLDPPGKIQRAYPDQKGNNSSATLQPESVPLKILVEFPDGHTRTLRRSQLYVDGMLTAERTSEPFDQFNWNLSEYKTSQRHVLQVKVQDTLGLSQGSNETPVEVQVDAPKQSWIKEQISPKRLAIGGSIFLAAIALGLVLWISGRKKWFSAAERRRRAHLRLDPVTQPVDIKQEPARRAARAGSESPSWPRPNTAKKAPAWLVRVNENNEPIPNNTLSIVRNETTIGSNSQQANCVIQEASIDGVHAYLKTGGDGTYLLSDAGSVAGTWINFSPVSSTGVRLEHGDLVHFGLAAYRFELANPIHIRKPQVSKYEEPL